MSEPHLAIHKAPDREIRQLIYNILMFWATWSVHFSHRNLLCDLFFFIEIIY